MTVLWGARRGDVQAGGEEDRLLQRGADLLERVRRRHDAQAGLSWPYLPAMPARSRWGAVLLEVSLERSITAAARARR